MSDRNWAGIIIANAIVLVVLAMALGTLADYVAISMGFRPVAGCRFYNDVQMYAATGCIWTVFAGVPFACLGRRSGKTLIVGGLALGILPMILNIYLTRIFGIGCLG